jgi:hypothetical protein
MKEVVLYSLNESKISLLLVDFGRTEAKAQT